METAMTKNWGICGPCPFTALGNWPVQVPTPVQTANAHRLLHSTSYIQSIVPTCMHQAIDLIQHAPLVDKSCIKSRHVAPGA